MGVPTVIAATLAAVAVAMVSPYLARLTVSVPERHDPGWWRARRTASTSRRTVVLAVGLPCGALAGASAGRIRWGTSPGSAPVWTAIVWWGLVWSGFVWLGMVVTPLIVIDVEHHRLPDRLVLLGFLGGAVLLGAATLAGGDASALARALVAAVVVLTVFSALTVTTGFGFGDTKLLTVLAGYLGWLGWDYVLCGIIAGFGVGALMSLPLLMSRRVGLRTAIPFGPALVTGALLVSGFGLVPAVLT